MRSHGEAASVDPVVLEANRTELKQLLDTYALCDIYNADETGLFWAWVHPFFVVVTYMN